MISYSSYSSRFGDLSQNQSTANLSRGLLFVNDNLRNLSTKYYFNEITFDVPGGTIAGVKSYDLPYNVKSVVDVYQTVGDLRYVYKEVPTAQFFDQLQFAQYSSDIPQYYWVFNKQIHVFPTPASSGNPITIRYKHRLRDLSQADYGTASDASTVTVNVSGGTCTFSSSPTITLTLSVATVGLVNGQKVSFSTTSEMPDGIEEDTTYYVINAGAIAATQTFQIAESSDGSAVAYTSAGSGTITLTPNSSQILGNSSAFKRDMADRWIQIAANSSSNTTSGDDNWYQILSVDTTNQILTLYNQYQGSTVTAGTYIIGEMPILPEDYQVAALYHALKVYYTSIVPEPGQYKMYEALYEAVVTALDAEFGNKSTNVAISSEEAELTNPNLYIRSIGE